MFIGIDELLRRFLNGKSILLVCCDIHCKRHNIEALKARITKTKEAVNIVHKPALLECLNYKESKFVICLNDAHAIECIAGLCFNTVADCGAIKHLNSQFLSRQR